jgi:hypothetical protein
MTRRTSTETITFLHPFRLSGVDDVQPAGPYLVETDEELLQTLLSPGYRRVSTFIRLAGTPGSNELGRIVDIDPTELAAARTKDAREHEMAPEA